MLPPPPFLPQESCELQPAERSWLFLGVASVQLLGTPNLEQHHLGQRPSFLKHILGPGF